MGRTVAKAERLNLLKEQLAARPRRVVELAREHGTSRRTIERDLVTLASGMGQRLEKDEEGRWYIPVKRSALNDVESLAVYSATRLLLHTGVGELHYRRSLEKLARGVPEPARAALLASVEKLEPAPEDRVLDQVAQAWFGRRVLKCDYASAHSADQRGTRELEVYFYELNRRNLEPYVLAYDRTNRHRVLVFKLARMSNVMLTDETYEIPADFDPNAELRQAFGILVGDEIMVRLRVTDRVAARMAEGTDRSLRVGGPCGEGHREAFVHGTVDPDGRPLELIPWLLSWGDSVEVIDPPHVRELVAEELRRALAAYGH